MITLTQGSFLISTAKNIINSSLNNQKYKLPEEFINEFREKRGIFVTLKKQGNLRGCIGYPEPILPLYKALESASTSAAFEDPRFPPLKKEELGSILLEISVLTIPKEMKNSTLPDSIKIGTHGLIIESNNKSGLLLPQVATEYNWTAEEFLTQTCLKAGLKANTWKEKNCKIFSFKAQIFSEKESTTSI